MLIKSLVSHIESNQLFCYWHCHWVLGHQAIAPPDPFCNWHSQLPYFVEYLDYFYAEPNHSQDTLVTLEK